VTTAPPPDGTGDGPRHSVAWYRERLDGREVCPGRQLLLRCVDGPARAWLETFPPRLEIEGRGGVYVLDDDGPVHRWTYRFVSTGV
jgi:hypothetical protein